MNNQFSFKNSTENSLFRRSGLSANGGAQSIIFGNIGSAQFLNNELLTPGFGGNFTSGTGNTLSITDLRNTTPFVVSSGTIADDPGEYSSISAALAAASAAVIPGTSIPLVYVKQGFYFESFTMPDSVYLLGEGNCAVGGTVTFQPSSTTVPPNVRGISFIQPAGIPAVIFNGDGSIGSGSLNISIINCVFISTNSTPAVVISEQNGGRINFEFNQCNFVGVGAGTGPHMIITGTNPGTELVMNYTEFNDYVVFNQHTSGEFYFITPTGSISYTQGPGPSINSYFISARLSRDTDTFPVTGPDYYIQVQGGQLTIIGSQLEKYDVLVSGTETSFRLISSEIVTDTQKSTIALVGGTPGCFAELIGSYISARSIVPVNSLIDIGNPLDSLYITGCVFNSDRIDLISGIGTYFTLPSSNIVRAGTSTIAGTVVINPATTV